MSRFTPALVLAKASTADSKYHVREDTFVNRLRNNFSNVMAQASTSLHLQPGTASPRAKINQRRTARPNKLRVDRSEVKVAEKVPRRDSRYEVKRQRYEDLQQAFYMYDVDGSGTISCKELLAILRSLGHNPTDMQIHELMTKVDSDGSGALDMTEFLRLMDVYFRFTFCDAETNLYPAFRLLSRSVGSRHVVRVGDIRDMIQTFQFDIPWLPGETDLLFMGTSDDDLLDFDGFLALIMRQ